MNWDAIGAIGQVLGSVAVFVTLGYLSIQVRHAEQAVKRSAAQRFLEEAREVTMHLSGNERLSGLVIKYSSALGGEAAPFVRQLAARGGATPEEALSLHWLQLTWWLHQARVIEHIEDLPPHDRTYFDGILRRAYATTAPISRLWYETNKATLEQNAVRYVDNLLAHPG